ncbi:MAG: MFS transporter [Ilumatobacter sp.]|nr:MFS transporter [Ilumatobacter sp.]
MPRARRTELVALTGAKVVSNTALRWVGPFLPTLERAFSTTTGTLTGVMGICELGGLTTVATGPSLDRGHERRVFTLGLVAVAVSSLIALAGTVPAFAVSFLVLILGVSNLTVAGHAWIGHRVPFAARGRAIGAFETSWAIALLAGAPLLAALIAWVGWRGPYVALAVGAVVAAVVVLRLVGADAPHLAERPAAARASLPRSAWPPMVGSALTAAAGIGTFVVSGAWLDDAYGLSTGGLGVVAAMFGLVELVSSTTVATHGDRIGARRSVLAGLVVLLLGVATMLSAGDSRTIAIAGLLVLLTGFEYGFVSSLTLVSEAAPEARGRAIGLSNAMGTVARATSVFVGGQLYEAFGMTGTLTLVSSCAVAAFVAFSLTRR